MTLQMLAQVHQESSLYRRRLAAVHQLHTRFSQAALAQKATGAVSAMDVGGTGSSAFAKSVGPREPATAADLCRMLLVGLYLGLDLHRFAVSLKEGAGHHIALLQDSSKLRRSLKLLDATPARECHKIGLVYVGAGHGQDMQNEILANQTENTSPSYRRFLSRLGARVSLRLLVSACAYLWFTTACVTVPRNLEPRWTWPRTLASWAASMSGARAPSPSISPPAQ